MSTPNPQALVPQQGGQLVASLATEGGAMTVQQLKANRELMQQVMAELMEVGKHYGKVPGTEKPTLLKAGAELLCVLFRVNAKPTVEDLSTPDVVRYRVIMRGIHIPTGQEIASGMGECSTNEDKYKWRAAKNRQEFDETPIDRRRWKWKGQGEDDGVNQVRTNPDDAANTVLKMAEKRAKVDLALSFSAASDVFQQDLDDLADWLKEKELGSDGAEPGQQRMGKQTARPPQARTGTSQQSGVISGAQLEVLKTQMDSAGVPENDVLKRYDVPRLEDLPFAKLNDALLFCKKVKDGGAG